MMLTAELVERLLAYLKVDLIADLAESHDLEILGKKLTWNKLNKRIYPLDVGWCGWT